MNEEANVFNQVLDFPNSLFSQLHEIPHFSDPILGGLVALGIAGSGIYMARKIQKGAVEEAIKEMGVISTADHDRLDQAVQKIAIKHQDAKTMKIDSKAIGREKLDEMRKIPRALLFAIGGLSIGLGSIISEPTVVSSSSPTLEAVVVMSATDSMLYTNDLSPNESRYQVGVDAIKDSSYSGNIGIVSYDQNAVNNVDMLPKNQVDFSQVTANAVSHFNGGYLDQALQNAEQMVSNNGSSSSKGEIIIYSDGTLVSNLGNTTLSNLVGKIQSRGIKVDIIAPGTNNATYSINGSNPFGSAVNITDLSFGPSPQFATTRPEVNNLMNQDLNSTPNSQTRKKEAWVLGPLAGLSIASIGLYGILKRYLKKIA